VLKHHIEVAYKLKMGLSMTPLSRMRRSRLETKSRKKRRSLLLLPGRVLSLQLLLSIESWFRCAEANQELLSRETCGIEARTGNCDRLLHQQ
jgi:hypothetical protein